MIVRIKDRLTFDGNFGTWLNGHEGEYMDVRKRDYLEDDGTFWYEKPTNHNGLSSDNFDKVSLVAVCPKGAEDPIAVRNILYNFAQTREGLDLDIEDLEVGESFHFFLSSDRDYNDGHNICGFCVTDSERYEKSKVVTPEEMMKALSIFPTKTLGKMKTVELNSVYTAKITKDGVTVGCQTFGLEVIDKLWEAKNAIFCD